MIERTLTGVRVLFGGAGLKGRAARGGLWLSGATAADQFSRFVRNIILARIIAPRDFGLAALVVATCSAFEALTEVGTRQCVIQNRDSAGAGFLNAAWWFSAVRGLLLYGVGLLAAPLVCRFYGRSELLPLLYVGFLVMPLSGLVSPRLHLLEKRMDFRRWVVVTQGSGVFGAATAVAVGLRVENAWALVAGIVAAAAGRLALSFVLCPFRPRLEIDRGPLRDLLTFARGMFGLPILMMVFLQAPIFILGRLRSMEELGVFTLAYGLANIPVLIAARTVVPLMLPVFAHLQEDREALGQAFGAAVKAATAVAMPLAAFMAVFSGQILALVYGPPYETGWPALSLLSVAMVFSIVNSCVVNLFLGLGMPWLHRRYSFVRVLLLLALALPLIRAAGATGAAISITVSLGVVLAAQLAKTRRLVGEGAAAGGRWDGPLLGTAVLLAAAGLRLALGASLLGLLLGAAACAVSLAVAAVRLAANLQVGGAPAGATAFDSANSSGGA